MPSGSPGSPPLADIFETSRESFKDLEDPPSTGCHTGTSWDLKEPRGISEGGLDCILGTVYLGVILCTP